MVWYNRYGLSLMHGRMLDKVEAHDSQCLFLVSSLLSHTVSGRHDADALLRPGTPRTQFSLVVVHPIRVLPPGCFLFKPIPHPLQRLRGAVFLGWRMQLRAR